MKIDPSILQGKGITSYTTGPQSSCGNVSSGSATDGKASARKPKRPAKKTVIHDAIWKAHGIPLPWTEFQFDINRKWRFDYAWPEYIHGAKSGRWVAVEIQGGLWTHGRHTRGKALQAEYEKLNEAQLAGWCVLLMTPEQIKSGEVFELVRRALA